MSSREVFEKFYANLVMLLPMDDGMFFAHLYASELLPDDLSSQVRRQSTSAERAVLFLDSAIQPSLRIGDNSTFMRLLKVMQEMEYINARQLAHQIKSELKEESSVTAG